jgi:hypothetical protein
MFKIFKTKIPTGSTREIDEVESWTIRWATHAEGYDYDVHHKVFTSLKDAEDYEIALYKAAKFLQAKMGSVKITKNT